MACKMLLALLFLATPSWGYYTFKSRIPNGDIVPHPCKANYMWGGVGHTNPDGGGANNQFGKDFDNSDYTWTEMLCLTDSDGDGKSNGEELGDPNCTWEEGSVPERVTGITHPGICDPFGEGVCAGRDEYVNCDVEKFDDSCEVIQNPGVMSEDLLFKEVEVPNTETNYYCQYFDLPSDQDYHVVADEGIIDNHDVVHHMLLYACPEDYKGSPTDDSPNPCSMNGENDCSSLISLWTVGLPGTCYEDKMGFRIGATRYKKVKLEIHYNNPMLIKGYTDNSGIRLYYQPAKPEMRDLATFAIGQSLIQIPPGVPSVEVEGSCPGDCTKSIITKPFYVVSTVNHMHYMGRKQRTEIIRNGQVVKIMANDERYDYDSPVLHKLDEPFEVLPGDEISTTCTYSSLSKKRWVYYGDATSDEMCFAFLTVYPFDALPHTKWCVMHGALSTCDFFFKTPRLGCDWSRFTNLSNPEMMEQYMALEHNCQLDGTCRPECREVAEEIKEHPCLGKEMKPVVSQFLETYLEGAKFLGKLHSCDGHEEEYDSHAHDSHDMDHDSHDMDHDSHDMDPDSHDMDPNSHDMDHDSHDMDHDSHDSHYDSHDKDSDMSDMECRRDCGHICANPETHVGDDDWASGGVSHNTAAILMTSLMAAILALLF